MTSYPEFTLAVVQAAPMYFDPEASTDKACGLIVEAGSKGAALTAFSETWLPGYPGFVLFDDNRGQARTDYLANGVAIPSPTTDRLCRAAKKGDTDVVIGIAELDTNTRGTIYCTLLFIGREGKILGRHRKLKPTGIERTVWGEGDGLGLTVYERPYGRISGLNCWEHAMVLPGYSLMAQGTQIHIAAWPTTSILRNEDWTKGILLSQAFALQGSCYVLVPCALMRAEDFPERYQERLDDWDWNAGEHGSCIIAPGGDILAAAVVKEETILTATVTLEEVFRSRTIVDVGGHYSRPDVLQLHVNSRPLNRVVYPRDPDVIEPHGTASDEINESRHFHSDIQGKE